MQTRSQLQQPPQVKQVRATFLERIRFFFRYKEYSVKAFQQMLQYRGRSFLFALGDATKFILLVLLWRAMYEVSPQATIGGISWAEMERYILLAMIVSYVVEMPFLGIFGTKIMDGNISIDFLRPIDIQTMLFFDVLGRQISNLVIICLPLGIGVSLYLGTVPFVPAKMFLGCIALLLGLATAFLIDYIIGTMGFWTTNVIGITGLKKLVFQIASGSLMPLTLLPAWLFAIVQYLPFQGIVYLPLQILLGRMPNQVAYVELFKQLIWVIVLIVVSRIIFSVASRRITVFGG